MELEEVVEAVDLLEDSDIEMISLADTVGVAAPAADRGSCFALCWRSSITSRSECICIAGPIKRARKMLAAYDAGCRRFDSALGGLGGCPFAQDALVGNIATEKVLERLRARRNCLRSQSRSTCTRC